MKINHISVSREGCYRECPAKYKFRYHLQLVSPEPTQVYFTFGKLVHRIAEEYVRGRGSVPIESITRAVLSGELELQPGEKAPPLDPEHQRKLVRHVGNFMRLTERIGTDGDVEWKFDVDMDGNGRILTGFIDRVIRRPNGFFLLDYKTTKPSPWRKDSRTITTDLQLQCYCYVICREFGARACDVEAALFYLDDYKLVPVRYSEATLRTVPERLLAAYRTIEDANPDKVTGNVGSHCRRCEWKSICPWPATR